jgi:divinyl protochlorophyllide a 8-vinyl-reductase
MQAPEPCCDFYAGTFARLIATLVAPRVAVVEVECLAQGGSACRFRMEGMAAG